jgi:hypothetical protein
MDSETHAPTTGGSLQPQAINHLCVVIYRQHSDNSRPTGNAARTQWVGSDGATHSLAVDAKQTDIVPEVKNGERVEWINLTDVPFRLSSRRPSVLLRMASANTKCHLVARFSPELYAPASTRAIPTRWQTRQRITRRPFCPGLRTEATRRSS